jgi:ADP-heptose:LPS heptosyltransferase
LTPLADDARILIVQMGGMGDLVLMGDLVHSIKLARPRAVVTVACRDSLRDVTHLYPRWPELTLGLELNPYLWTEPSPEMLAGLTRTVHRLRGVRPDVVVEASLIPTWFGWIASSTLDAPAAVACTRARPQRGLLPLALREIGFPRRDFEGPEPGERMHERERYRAIAAYLGVETVEQRPWGVAARAEAEAAERRTALGIEAGRYLACFPAGTANVGIKSWPLPRFAEALGAFQEEFGLPVLLMGSETERAELEALRDATAHPGGPLVEVFAGGTGDLFAVAGLTAGAAVCLGNDTGLLHLAQAYEVPGVVVFGGGGHWRSYAPWGRGTVGVVHHLPCFDCEWDCVFGHPVCLEAIPAAPVVQGLRRAMCEPRAAPEWISVQSFSTEVLRLLGDAGATYREARRDQADRLSCILELEAALREREADLERLRAARGAQVNP